MSNKDLLAAMEYVDNLRASPQEQMNALLDLWLANGQQLREAVRERDNATQLNDQLTAQLNDERTMRMAAEQALAECRKERDALKHGYEYLQDRLESIGYHGWAHDEDEVIQRAALAKEAIK